MTCRALPITTCDRAHGPDETPIVIDTNRVLDLWLFDEPRVNALRRAVQDGAARWIATTAMRDELVRVLGYPWLAAQLLRRQRDTRQVLAAFDRWAESVPAAPACAVRCGDPDDQMFIDLSVAWRAALFSKDRLVLGLATRLAPYGVSVQAGDGPA